MDSYRSPTPPSSFSLCLIKRRRKIPSSRRRRIEKFEEEKRLSFLFEKKQFDPRKSGRTPAVSSIHNHGFDLADGEAI